MRPTRRSAVAGIVATTVVVSLVACGSPEPVALDLGDSERVIAYDAATVEFDSTARIGFEPVQVFGASDTGAGPLYRPIRVVVDGAGTVCVLDEGNKNIVVFAADGALLRTFGREGEGPGELRRPRGLAVVGDTTFAITDHGRMGAWDASGELLQDIRLQTTHPHLGLDALDDGTLVVSHAVSPGSPSDIVDSYIPQVIAGYAPDGTPVREYVTTPRLSRLRGVTPMGDLPTSAYAVDPAGRIYVTDGASYDVLAIDADGSRPWRLSVALPPESWTDADTDRVMASLRIPGTVSDFTWPDVLPSLFVLKVDGHGHLYVYRFMRLVHEQDHRIVDVYDRDGNHLFSGTHSAVPWSAAQGDYVYAIEEDEASGGHVVVAYRLIEPFD